MKFPLYIAKRYLFSRGSTQAINIITAIAAIGIVVGALSLFVVLSAFDGLKGLHLEFTSIADPDLKVFPQKGKFFSVSDSQKEQLKAIDEVISYAEVIENQVLLSHKEKKETAVIKGVDLNYSKVISTDSLLVFGEWYFEKDFFVVVGNQISNTLGLGVNDYNDLLDMYMPKPGKGQITNPLDAFRHKGAVVSGIYQLTNELDNKYIFAHINLARELLNLPKDQVSNIELKLKKDSDYNIVIAKLEQIFDEKIYTKDRLQLNDAMYKMLNTENLAVYLVFTLVLIVALFNLIGAMIMMIIDKKKNLQTLYKLGASVAKIRLVFFLQGMLMTIIGGLAGVFIGVILVKLQQISGIVMITPSMPYPTKLNIINGIMVLGTLYILGIIASGIAAASIKKELVA